MYYLRLYCHYYHLYPVYYCLLFLNSAFYNVILLHYYTILYIINLFFPPFSCIYIPICHCSYAF